MKKRPARSGSRAALLTTEVLATARGGGWLDIDIDVDVDVPMTYEKINWKWRDSGGGATDDWESPP